ncbi:MAG: biopolymer transporter ExbD [Ectothiorhodospiraceae bacterium]|nr:biopolymer transporter ExbD [Ectothiorhodospiraceae bacterium]
MKYRVRRAGRQQQIAELNVTAFMNLMVGLVPFLLIMAVFSRITIHELSLPGAASAPSDDPPALQLEVIMRADRLVLADRGRSTLQEIVANGEGYDLEALSEALQRIKRAAPDVDRATVLVEPQVGYQSLISVMDVLRGGHPASNGEAGATTLFPRIAIGDAPAKEGGSR